MYALCFLVLTYLSCDLIFSVLFIQGTEDSQQEEEELRSICCNASRKGDGPTSRTNKEDPGT